MKARYPKARVGDRFGHRVVTKTGVRIGTGKRSSNEAVDWRCDCGERGRSFVFNLRSLSVYIACIHPARERAA